MAIFEPMRLTKAGRTLLNRAQTGTKLSICGVAVGDGRLGAGETAADITQLKNPISATCSMISTKILNDTETMITVRVRSGDQTMTLREIGVLAVDPDSGESVLYAYTNAGDYPDFIPAAKATSQVIRDYSIVIAVGDTANLEVTNISLAEVTRDEFEAVENKAHTHDNKTVIDSITSEEWDNKVDKTQYASVDNVGVIKLHYGTVSGQKVNRSGIVVGNDGTAYISTKIGGGISRDGSGQLHIVAATDDEIAAGTDIYKPITPSNLEYAVNSVVGKSIGSKLTVEIIEDMNSFIPTAVQTTIYGTAKYDTLNFPAEMGAIPAFCFATSGIDDDAGGVQYCFAFGKFYYRYWSVNVDHQNVWGDWVSSDAPFANIKKNPNATDGDIITSHLTVGGRQPSDTYGIYSFVSGIANSAQGESSAVLGGQYHRVEAEYSVILGGDNNRITSTQRSCAILGGDDNSISGGSCACILGGNNNSVTADGIVLGGYSNVASSTQSVVIGASESAASGSGSMIIGGDDNIADGYLAIIVGSEHSTCHERGIVLGGDSHTALLGQIKAGHYSKDGTAGTYDGTTGDAFVIGNGTDSAKSNCFRAAYDGNVYGMAAFNSTGADYAEYFEWADGNPDNEDRRGLFVTLDGDKVRIANSNDEVIGIVSAAPCVVGNSYDDTWQGMYLTDVFGQPLTHMVHHEAEYKEVEVHDKDEDGNELGTTHTEQALVRREYDAEEYIINPDYDPEQVYIPRSQRKEWATVGMFGQIVAVDNGSCTVGGYCTAADDGTATTASAGYRVLKRLDETHIRILFK